MTEIHMNPSYAHLQGSTNVDAAQPTDLPGNGHSAVMQNSGQEVSAVQGATQSEDAPSIDIFINNVVCTFNVRSHLNLHRIGLEGINVEYRKEYGKVTMRFRRPSSTATIWSSGKITMTGNDGEENAMKSARRCARALQKLGFRVRFHNYKIVNVLGTCAMPWGIRIANFSKEYPREASYEPELHPAVTYKIKSPKATLKIFSTGSITCTAPSVGNVQSAIHHIYPLVLPFKKILTQDELDARGSNSKNAAKMRQLQQQRSGGGSRKGFVEDEELQFDKDELDSEEEIEEDMYSDDDSDFD